MHINHGNCKICLTITYQENLSPWHRFVPYKIQTLMPSGHYIAMLCVCVCVAVDTVVPLSQDEATEGTMSSEALPLIFEPFEDVTPEGAAAAVTLVPGSTQPPAAMATGGMPLSEVDLDQLVTLETDSDSPSNAPSLLMPDWTSPWQTSGAELLEPISSSVLSVSQQQAGTEPEDGSERGEGGDASRIHRSVFKAGVMLCDTKSVIILLLRCIILPHFLHSYIYFRHFPHQTIVRVTAADPTVLISCMRICFWNPDLVEGTVPKQIKMAQWIYFCQVKHSMHRTSLVSFSLSDFPLQAVSVLNWTCRDLKTSLTQHFVCLKFLGWWWEDVSGVYNIDLSHILTYISHNVHVFCCSIAIGCSKILIDNASIAL